MFRRHTWLTIVPRKPTIIRLQITSDFTTKFQDSLNSVQKLGRSSAVCCSARIPITFDACALASSPAEERISDNSSCSAVMSTGSCGELIIMSAQRETHKNEPIERTVCSGRRR